jgi:hypothetical protein
MLALLVLLLSAALTSGWLEVRVSSLPLAVLLGPWLAISLGGTMGVCGFVGLGIVLVLILPTLFRSLEASLGMLLCATIVWGLVGAFAHGLSGA